MKWHLFIFGLGLVMFVTGLLSLMLSQILIFATTQQGAADYPAAMYYAVAALPFMYAGRCMIDAAWAIDKNE